MDYLVHELANKKAAEDFLFDLEDAIQRLRDFPQLAPVVKNRFIQSHEIRKAVVKQYLVYYYVDDSRRIIDLVTIRHALENENSLEGIINEESKNA